MTTRARTQAQKRSKAVPKTACRVLPARAAAAVANIKLSSVFLDQSPIPPRQFTTPPTATVFDGVSSPQIFPNIIS